LAGPAALQLLPLLLAKHQPQLEAQLRERAREIAARVHQPLNGVVRFRNIDRLTIELFGQFLIGTGLFTAHVQKVRPVLLHGGADLLPLRLCQVEVFDDFRTAPPGVNAFGHLREQAGAPQ